MKVLYISGPYSNGDWEIMSMNIMRAREVAIKLWKQGFAVICPHSNTAHFDALIPDKQVFIRGDLEILKRCDVIYMMRDWLTSYGAKCELRLAQRRGLEVIYE